MTTPDGNGRQPLSGAGKPTSVADRMKALMVGDAQFRAAVPLPAVAEAKSRPELNLAQITAVVMEGYADRPALAQRATRLVTDPASGRRSLELLDVFQSLSYRELWSRARALAGVWHHDADRSLRADEFLCILAFAGIDFATVDLAAIHNGAVVVPVQTNAPLHQQAAILQEVEPRWLACSLECLDNAVELVLAAWRPVGLLVFDYHPEVDDEREVFEAAQARLAAAGLPQLLQTLPTLCERGAALPPAPLHAAEDAVQRLCTIYYTSGSTGTPKGAMYPEHMVRSVWRVKSPLPFLYVHYMPMNHSFGRSGMFSTLGNGGLCCFTARSDLSTLLEDIRSIRPTFMGIVPRICELIQQRYQAELARRTQGGADAQATKQAVLTEFREGVLGGRLLSCSFGSAPLSSELRAFMEECLGFPLDDNYGATEVSGVLRNTRITRPPVIDYKLDDVPELGYFKTDKPHPRGELWVKTSSIMLGYYKRPDATAAMFDADGYYKTGDIMAEIGTDQLVYVDRRNNVLKLAQGEFVAIARLEALYTAGHPLIRQVYLYGTSERAYLLAAIVPNEEELVRLGIAGDGKAIKAALREAVQAVAQAEALNAYEVPRDFLVEHEPFSTENGLLAGIGKYLRPNFKARYGERLEALYAGIAATQASELLALRLAGRDAPVRETVARAVQATLGIEDLDPSSDHTFADLGGDSLAALSCSTLLEEIFEIEVPVDVINHPTGGLQHVARFIERVRNASEARPSFASVHGAGATTIRASDLRLECFIDQATLEAATRIAPPASDIRTVLLTGANGYLGRFLCLEWLERMARVGGRVICITRGQDDASARQRIAEVFDSGDAELLRHFSALAERHLEVLAGDLSEPDLGLSAAHWHRLAETVDLIVHPAALVNHVLPYSQLFGPNVVGTAELIRLALTHRLKRFDNVSTVAAAMLENGEVIHEDADVRGASPERRLDAARYANGYAASKWAGEVLLREAHERYGLPVVVFRSDMILAHSRWRGQLNVPDMFTRWLYSIIAAGIAPRSFYVGEGRPHYDGLPVDFTAAAMATLGASAGGGFRTYHVVNPHDDGISMDTFIDWAVENGHPIQRIDDYADWLARFETALRGLPEKQRQQSSLPLIHQLRRPMPAQSGASVSASRFRADVLARGVGAQGDIPHLSRAFIGKVMEDLRHLAMI
ncbi:MAG TPA: carboxylic acid reductase [Ramlibacter sp.]|nr:carboxylic acid reductase [Ramlibacter sp.]